MSNKLPLRLERLIADQPTADCLPLSLNRLHGEAGSAVYVWSNALPLPLTRLIADRPASSALPLPLTRRLRTVVDAGTGGGDPTDPEEPQFEYGPAMPSVSACFTASNTTAYNIDRLVSIDNIGSLIANDHNIRYSKSITISQRFALQVKHFVTLANCNNVLTGLTYQIAACDRVTSIALILLSHEQRATTSASIGYSHCSIVDSAKALHYQQCMTVPLQSTIEYATAKSANNAGEQIAQSAKVKISKAVQVPCRYYPIPDKPVIPEVSLCAPRPPSNQLPLRMTRKRQTLPASALPLPLTCWHDDAPPVIPNLRSYIVHNVITATIGGISVDPLSFGIKADMDGYCWQGNITINTKDYAKVKAKLDAPRGAKPMVNVLVNGDPYSFIAEHPTRTRKLANHTHSITGRSASAYLSSDYLDNTSGGIIDQASYASQIASAQLVDLPISIAEFDVSDWLIPASQYSTAGKTPINVLSDIAKSCGGFIISDPSQATISIKKRWKVSAWEIATATPDVTVPADVMREISETPRVNPLYNIVTLTSAVEGGHVYRQGKARNSAAPAYDHPLYTDRDAIVPAGQAILSDSGNHIDYTLSIRYADKYNIPLAELGQIWQFNDPEGAWRGLITGVDLDVSRSNDAPTIWQTINIDRYTDT